MNVILIILDSLRADHVALCPTTLYSAIWRPASGIAWIAA